MRYVYVALCWLQSGAIQALVLDSYLLDYSAARTCDLMTVGAVWDEASHRGVSTISLTWTSHNTAMSA